MGLYLCVFASADDDEEIDGVEVGSYDDFYALRTAVANELEGGDWSSRFPILMSHSDSDGEWSANEAGELSNELRTIKKELLLRPSHGFQTDSWQADVAKTIGLSLESRVDDFIDVDGESLLMRLINLAEIAVRDDLTISFQ